jgi:hypothetical protein
MGKRSDLPVEEKLARIDRWRTSGLPLKEYLSPLNEDIGLYTSWLRWEKRWRGLEEPKVKTDVRAGFVQAVALRRSGMTGSGLQVVLRSASLPGLQAQVSWPLGQELSSARWLREVFK